MRILQMVIWLNNRFALLLGKILSWSVWPALILAGTMTGLALRQEDLVMVLLTVQTSIDAAATKMLQSQVREAEINREAAMERQLATITRTLDEVRVQNERAAERDRLAVKRDKAILGALSSLSDFLLHFVIEKGGPDVPRGATTTRSRRSRKTNGRANRPKS